MLTRSLIIAAFAAAATFLTGASAWAQGKGTVAVVDVQKAFDALKEKVQVEAELQTQADVVRTEDNKRATKLKELQQDLSILAAGSQAFDRKQEELERAALDRQVWLQFQQNKLNRERALRIEGIYSRMVNAIGRVAQGGGFKVVLFKEPIVNLSQITKPEQVSAVIGSRKLLWASDDLDLTDEVIQKMNNEFTAGGATPVPSKDGKGAKDGK